MTIFESLTSAEELLRQACARGAWLDLRTGDADHDRLDNVHDWDERRTIRAEVIQALLLGAVAAEEGCAAAIRLRGARISGRLDLMGAVADRPLIVEHCHFDEEIRLVEATTRTVRLVQSRLVRLNGARLRLEGLLNLYGSTVAHGVRLDRAKVASEVFMEDAVLEADEQGVALAADGLTVDGNLDCSGLRARGTLRLQGMRVAGFVKLSNAHVTGNGRMAVDAEASVVEGRFQAAGLHADGEVRIRHVQVGASLQLGGARLNNPGGLALGAGGLAVTGGVWCGAPFTAVGEVRLIGARLGANLSFIGAGFANEGGIALNLDHATVDGAVMGDDLTLSAGQVSLVSAQLRGGLDLRRARLRLPQDGEPLVIEGAAIDGPARFDGLQARGRVRVRNCRFGGPVLFMRAEFDNPGGMALRFTRNEVAADLNCEDMIVHGEVRMGHTRIARDLNFGGVVLANPGGVALEATGLHVGELAMLPRDTPDGVVILDHAHVGRLRDDPARWPAAMHLNGLTYESMEPQLTARARLRWLHRDTRGYQPQPYEQLAAFYTLAGHPVDARTVLYAKERRIRGSKTFLGRVWSVVQDITVGFGYKPWRAAAWLVVLLVAGSVVYGRARPPALKRGEAPDFNPVIYTLDLLLPFVDLGQQGAYNPAGGAQWLAYGLIAAGWVLATTIARGVARVLGR
ncbi:hypothetical protein GCM10022226_40740 [Sphaerisporangium flaviroseum]|uniref:Membrane-associated oxidoreductase n=1 Tax=Sphaerisporangium flaviroseum TaxID=509199 RepID=A0ABP7IDL5_9ACTN